MAKQKKIIVRLFGGIGNQLFSYAAARRMAIVHNCRLIIDGSSGFVSDTVYGRNYQLHHFNIDVEALKSNTFQEKINKVYRFLIRPINKIIDFNRRWYIVQEFVDFDERLLSYAPVKSVWLEGYWQSEQYFKDVEDVIREDMVIKPPTDQQNLLASRQINDLNSVAIHVRFFDAPDECGDSNASISYYQNAISNLEKNFTDLHYFIFSDNVDSAREIIALPDERITMITHNQGDENAFADLWLMSQCNHFIIANSTFSWWGAWLSNNKDKVVIAPGFEKRKGKMAWGFDGLLPGEWIKL